MAQVSDRKWPDNKSTAREALRDTPWLTDLMTGDTRTMDDLLELAEFTVQEMQNFSKETGWGLLDRHYELAKKPEVKESNK